MIRLRLFLAAALLMSCARASRPDAAPGALPGPPPQVDRWTTKLDAQDPLVGRVWDVARGTFITRDALLGHLASAEIVALGEKHDNPDHHRLQALVVRGLLARGRRPDVAFEMIEVDQQPLIEAFLAQKPTSAAGLGAAVKWDDRGWPTWGDYEPIAQAAVEARLPILAANLPHAEARAVAHAGLGALDDARVQRLGLDRPLSPEIEASLADELRASHCGHLPEAMIAPMALAQRARDATMASVLLARHHHDGVLIAGAGHARNDRGVPLALHAQEPTARVASLAFVEVEHGLTTPGDYAARFGTRALPFDFVWFTPRLDDDDPCEKFKKKP
jgi:uncharacterized iron-regulated protein